MIMKKIMRRLGGLFLVLTLMLSASVTALAEGDGDGGLVEYSISGIPEGTVKVGDTITVQVSITDAKGYSDFKYSFDGPFESSGFVEGDFDGNSATITATIYETSEPSMDWSLSVSGVKDGNSDRKRVLYKEGTISIQQPKLTILSGVPTGSVVAGSKAEIQVKAEGLNPNKTYSVEVSGLTADQGTAQTITRQEEAVITFSGRVSEYASTDACFDVYLYETTGSGDDISESYVTGVTSSSFEITERVKLSLSWKMVDQVAAGTAYPFSVTITNVSGTDMRDIYLDTYTPWHTKQWSATVTCKPQEGVTVNGAIAAIAELKAGDTITIQGTVVYPAEAAGDTTHLATYLYEMEDGNEILIANAETRAHQHLIVAEGSGEKPGQQTGSQTGSQNQSGQAASKNGADSGAQAKAARTGDTAPVAGVFAALLVSVFAMIVAVRKKVQ